MKIQDNSQCVTTIVVVKCEAQPPAMSRTYQVNKISVPTYVYVLLRTAWTSLVTAEYPNTQERPVNSHMSKENIQPTRTVTLLYLVLNMLKHTRDDCSHTCHCRPHIFQKQSLNTYRKKPEIRKPCDT